jgi:hypothetical protein
MASACSVPSFETASTVIASEPKSVGPSTTAEAFPLPEASSRSCPSFFQVKTISAGATVVPLARIRCGIAAMRTLPPADGSALP